MVRAILNGTKTQTRRVVKPAPETVTNNAIVPWNGNPSALMALLKEHRGGCPYGQPGDRLWVRETWRTGTSLNRLSPNSIASACDEANYRKPWAPIKYEADGITENADVLKDFGGWGKTRVSIHMPRWASRLTLEITEVRVERLNEMSGEDAYEEGTQTWVEENLHLLRDGNKWASQKHAFQALWESINGPGSWERNPWVWVVGFKRVEGGAK
jgi:hypothetical protein